MPRVVPKGGIELEEYWLPSGVGFEPHPNYNNGSTDTFTDNSGDKPLGPRP